MTLPQQIITIALCVLGTMTTRFLPFSIFHGTHAIPELIAILTTTILHLKNRQMLLSIAGGTVCYMLLLHFVFI